MRGLVAPSPIYAVIGSDSPGFPLSLSALPTALAVPPINLVLPCLAGLAILRQRPQAAYWLIASGLAGLLLLSLPIVSDTLLASLESHLPLQASVDDPPGAIVILSGDIASDGPALGPGALTLERERVGAALYRRTKLPILVTGGLVGTDGQTLGGLMAASLVADFQVPVRWIEPLAQDTAENARFSAAILHREGIRSILLVTHAWHMKRSVLAFAGTGITITAAPVRRDGLPKVQAAAFVPRAKSWQDSYYAMHEWIGYGVATAALLYRAAVHADHPD